MKSTDEIDSEIKKVQLQRERLALERELANERLKKRILAGPKAAGSLIAAFLFGLKASVLGWWKPIVGITLIASTTAGVYAWLEYRREQVAREEERIASERYHQKLNAHIEKKCGRFCRFGGDGGDFISIDGGPCKQTPEYSHVCCERQEELYFRMTPTQ